MKALGFSCLFGVCALAHGQAVSPAPLQEPVQLPSYANYSLMLVSPVVGGGAVVLMHDPKNALEFVPVNSTKQALDAGFVAVRAGELDQLIGVLREENARLEAENAQLRGQKPQQIVVNTPVSSSPSEAEIAERQREQIEAEKTARRQQLIQAWIGLQNMNRPQTFNVNVYNCARFPASCVGK